MIAKVLKVRDMRRGSLQETIEPGHDVVGIQEEAWNIFIVAYYGILW